MDPVELHEGVMDPESAETLLDAIAAEIKAQQQEGESDD